MVSAKRLEVKPWEERPVGGVQSGKSNRIARMLLSER